MPLTKETYRNYLNSGLMRVMSFREYLLQLIEGV